MCEVTEQNERQETGIRLSFRGSDKTEADQHLLVITAV